MMQCVLHKMSVFAVVVVCMGIVGFADTTAQVTKKVVVEHFTNTRCSICGVRNPGFYSNLIHFPNVIHLAIHPSAPYSSCVLNKHNVAENDARTKWYGIYGSTPRLVIQGRAISAGADYNDAMLFSSQEGQLSPLSLHVMQMRQGEDSMKVTVVVRTEAEHSFTSAKLFVAVAEDTVFYNAPNGEKQHVDVFRRSALGSAEGVETPLRSEIGDTKSFTSVLPLHADWNAERVRVVAILQHVDTKEVLQAEATTGWTATTGVADEGQSNGFALYPNPATTHLTISAATAENASGEYTVEMVNALGQRVAAVQNVSLPYAMPLGASMPAGSYYVKITGGGNTVVQPFIKVNE